MARIWQFFTHKSALSYLLMTALALGGLASAFVLQRESAPEIQVPVAIVTTVLPGASPRDVEELVTNEIEKAVAGIENVDTVTSTSREGVSSVTVEFEADADLENSIQDVKDAVDTAQSELPEDANESVVSDVNFADQPIMILSLSSDQPVTRFRALVEEVQDELERVAGVSDIGVSGIAKREVSVIVNRESLLAHELTLEEIVRGLVRADAKLPLGDITVGGVEYPLVLEGSIDDTSMISSIPLRTTSGAVIYVRDIAFVADGVAPEESRSRVSVGGEPAEQAAALTVFKQRGADVTRVSALVRERLAELEGSILADSQVLIAFDSGEFVNNDLRTLGFTGLQTIALVITALLLALGWREALIAGFAIPLTFFIAFMGLYVTGNTLNFISLFSLVLSIGILVDSAIVVVEGIHTNMKQRTPPGAPVNGNQSYLAVDKKEAALKAIADYHFPITTGTLTTIAVFVPLFTVSGVTGEFIAAIPATLLFVLFASLLVALAFIPLIASTFLRRRSATTLEQLQEAYAQRLRNWYRAQVTRILGKRRRENWFMAGIALVFAIVISLPVLGIIKVEFFPAGDVDFLFIEVELPVGSTLDDTDLALRAVEEMLYEVSEIESFTSTVGAGSSFNQNAQSGARYANITLNLSPVDERERTSAEILAELDERYDAFAQFEVTVSQPDEGPPTGAPVLITFSGEDLDALNQIASQAKGVLDGIEGVRNSDTSAQDDAAEFQLRINRAKAAALGVSPATIASEVRTAVFGTEAITIKGLDEEIDVVVKLDLTPEGSSALDRTHTTLDIIRELPIPAAEGFISLGSVAEVSLAGAQERIRHEDQERIVTVSSEVQEGAFATDIIAQFEDAFAKKHELPAGVSMETGGETEDVDQSFRDMFRALGIGVVLILAVLVIQFNSYKQAAFILTVVPLSLIGVLLGLLLTGQALSFPAMLGFIALAGIVVNNAIILVDVINNLRRMQPDMSVYEAVLDGATSRLRPILLTTITTIAGITPLIFVSQLWQPIAYAIIFGLAFTLVVTLVLVPVIYNRWPGEVS